jgi:hypothetical protein
MRNQPDKPKKGKIAYLRSKPIKTTIHSHLVHIERAESVRVLFACEAGSRAWGFPSADSDYDVRFLYLRPTGWYLTIDPGRDVIERPIDANLDITGWDLKKALQLLRKSNPPLMEWLNSPIIYWEQTSAAVRMRALAPLFHMPATSARHYLRMAQRSWAEYQSKGASLKMLFYSLRALLAVSWIEQDFGVAPTEFSRLLDRLIADSSLRGSIEVLMAVKAGGAEKDAAGEVGQVVSFIQAELARREAQPALTAGSMTDSGELDRLFRDVLREVWDP